MSKIIILEGPDRCGKSTQIKMLMKNLINEPTHVIHYSSIPGLSKEECINFSKILYDDMFQLSYDAHSHNRNLIFDRAHLGEYVYGPIYRGYSGDYIFDIEEKWKKNSFWDSLYLFVFIDKPENLISREDGLSFSVELEKKKQEINNFKEAFDKSKIKKKFLLNIQGFSPKEVHDYIIQCLK